MQQHTQCYQPMATRAFSPNTSRHSRLSLQRHSRPRSLLIANCLKTWYPVILYAFTTVAFFIAISMWRDEVFAYLDELAQWLRSDEDFGQAILFALIFLTTIPPIPLYSTLIILSGYTFGAWTGAIISYFAALSGALTVFVVSRALLRESISRWLASTLTIKRVVRAIEKRPKLLFLIRLAPYPYNVMNCLLAASPTLTLKTYATCTALSLFKVIIHTAVGASIHSFKDYNSKNEKDGSINDDEGAHQLGRWWAIIGVLLCIFIFVYLSIVANRAVDEELVEEDGTHEERTAFLQPFDIEADDDREESGSPMAESPFRTQNLHPC